MFSGFAGFQTLERKKDWLDLIPELMRERAEKSLALGFKNAGFRGGGIAFLFGLFDVLVDRGSRAKIKQIKDRCTSVDGDPISDRYRGLVKYASGIPV